MSAYTVRGGDHDFDAILAEQVGKIRRLDGAALAGIPVYLDGDGELAVVTDVSIDEDGVWAESIRGVVMEAGVAGDLRNVVTAPARGMFPAAAAIAAGVEYCTAGVDALEGLGYVALGADEVAILHRRRVGGVFPAVPAGAYFEATVLVNGMGA